MFMGVGALKVKGLYRKLRRLALRYGGVIVFFDEADSLGNRGQVGGGVGGCHPAAPWTTAPACNGMAYLSPATQRRSSAASLAGQLGPHAPTES